jgi:hypothetical protein
MHRTNSLRQTSLQLTNLIPGGCPRWKPHQALRKLHDQFTLTCPALVEKRFEAVVLELERVREVRPISGKG